MRQHVVEEEPHPDAGSASLSAETVDAVIPVAGAEQRQAVGADMPQCVIDRATAMFVDVAALERWPRNDDPGILAVGRTRPFEISDLFIEHALVAGRRDVARKNIGQPEMGVACLGALAETGLAIRRAMPPFQHIAFKELLASVQQDLFARESRLEEDQRQNVLQLIAITERAASLVRTHPAEQTRGHRLVRQPDVDEPIEIRTVRSEAHFAEKFGPMGARRREMRLNVLDPRRARGIQSEHAVGRLANDDCNRCLRARSDFDVAREHGDAASIIVLRRVGRAGFDHRWRDDIASRTAKEAFTDGLLDRIEQTGRYEGDAALKIVFWILERDDVVDDLGFDEAGGAVGVLAEHDVEERRHPQAHRFRPDVA